MLDAPLPESGPWPLVGIRDGELAQVAWNLERGMLVPLGEPSLESIKMSVVPIEQVAGRGPYNADIYWNQSDGTPRGPFELIKPAVNPAPTYPMLWAHDAKRERMLMVEPDSEGQVKSASGRFTQADLQENTARAWEKASHVHYNRDLQFNSQSLVVATTEQPCIGGRAWPSVIFEKPEHEYAFALWCNSTLGILMHWWVSNKTQSGRGTTTVTSIPNIPTLDVRTLTDQLASARPRSRPCGGGGFSLSTRLTRIRRAELDHRLLVDVLGLPEELAEPGGPMDLLRRLRP